MATFTDKQKQEIESARLRVSSGKGTPTDRKNISYFDKNTPKGVAQEKPAGDISGTLPKAPTVDDIFNFKTSLGEALNEATQVRKQQQVSALGPYMEGLPNSAIGTALGAIRQGANVSAESLFKFGVEAQSEAYKIQSEVMRSNMDLFKTMASDGSLGSLPDEALMSISKSAGIDVAQALAWRTSVKKKDDIAIQSALQDIEYKKAQIAHERRIRTDKDTKPKLQPTLPKLQPTLGFFDSDVEAGFRQRLNEYKEKQTGDKTLTDSIIRSRLRSLFSNNEVSDSALDKAMGINAIGIEELDATDVMPGQITKPTSSKILGGGSLMNRGGKLYVETEQEERDRLFSIINDPKTSKQKKDEAREKLFKSGEFSGAGLRITGGLFGK